MKIMPLRVHPSPPRPPWRQPQLTTLTAVLICSPPACWCRGRSWASSARCCCDERKRRAADMNITIKISPKRIADLMISAIEGNHMTRAWCVGVHLSGTWEKKINTLSHPWYSDPRLYEGEFTVEVVELTDAFAGRERNKTHRLNQEDFAEGLRLMAERHGRHFGDFMAKNDDAITA